MFVAVNGAQATTGQNDYPYAGSGIDEVDRWNFYTRECTSFVAWRLNNDAGIGFTNQYKGVQWGNAGNWGDAARAVGIPVDNTPTVGSVAQFPPGNQGTGSYGHVAWVIGVNGNTITVEDYRDPTAYNGYTDYTYNQRTFTTDGVNFIHFTNAAPPETWANPHTNKYLDLYRVDPTNLTKIQIHGWTGSNAQWWTRVDAGNGYSKLGNKGTGKCLAVRSAATGDGAKVIEWDCNGNPDQSWKWEPKGRDFDGWPVYQFRNRNSGRCLDIPGFATADETQLVQWSCNGGWNQEWY